MTEEHAIYGLPSENESRAAQWRRFFNAAGCRTQAELAEFLRLPLSSISETTKNDPVPDGWLLEVLRRCGANPEWVRSGTLPEYLRPDLFCRSESSPAVHPACPHAWIVRSILGCLPAEELLHELRRRNGTASRRG